MLKGMHKTPLTVDFVAGLFGFERTKAAKRTSRTCITDQMYWGKNTNYVTIETGPGKKTIIILLQNQARTHSRTGNLKIHPDRDLCQHEPPHYEQQ